MSFNNEILEGRIAILFNGVLDSIGSFRAILSENRDSPFAFFELSEEDHFRLSGRLIAQFRELASRSQIIGIDVFRRFKSINVNGVLEQSQSDITVMGGESTVTVNSDTYTLDLGDITLAKVNTTMDYIYNEGNLWKVHKAIGKIDSYDGETINTDYVSTTGSLTTSAEVYYVLETPIEVTIEDEDLTDTLNQIVSSPLPTGSNTMSITNPDVTPNLTVSYYDYEENNQYRKYVYIIDTSNFEEI